MGIIKKHKRIFYRPGMISLLLIPLLCLYFFYKNDSLKVYGALDISITDDRIFKDYNVPTLRKYKKFDFNETKSNEKYKLTNLHCFVRELIKNNDTINGAKVHFSSKTDYDTFVSVIDILNLEKIPTWAFYKNDFWVFVRPIRKPSRQNIEIRRMICLSGRMNKEDELRMEEKNKQKEFELKVSLFKKYWVLFLGYFGIFILNIFVLIKFSNSNIIH